jgi:hypothetical protein
MNFTVRGASWKYGDVVVRSDVAAAARRLPAWAPSEPKIEHIAAPSLPSVQKTAQRILEALQRAERRALAASQAAQPASDTSADEESQKTLQNGY